MIKHLGKKMKVKAPEQTNTQEHARASIPSPLTTISRVVKSEVLWLASLTGHTRRAVRTASWQRDLDSLTELCLRQAGKQWNPATHVTHGRVIRIKMAGKAAKMEGMVCILRKLDDQMARGRLGRRI